MFKITKRFTAGFLAGMTVEEESQHRQTGRGRWTDNRRTPFRVIGCKTVKHGGTK